MIILTIRTDKPEAEIGLFDGTKQLAYEQWQAHRQLAETIHQKIQALLALQGPTLQTGWQVIEGIVFYKGPGSFTGLRIGLSVANALAVGLSIPIVAQDGEDWIKAGINGLEDGQDDKLALPEYGSPVHITPPKH